MPIPYKLLPIRVELFTHLGVDDKLSYTWGVDVRSNKHHCTVVEQN